MYAFFLSDIVAFNYISSLPISTYKKAGWELLHLLNGGGASYVIGMEEPISAFMVATTGNGGAHLSICV